MFNLKGTIRNRNKEQAGPSATVLPQAMRAGVPAVLYGEGIKENLNLWINEKDLDVALNEAGESSLLELEVEAKKYEVLIHQLAKDPLTDKVIHIDFFKPSTKKKIEAEVPLEFIGESIAVKDLGGTFMTELDTIHVKGLAHQLPREIKVDISGLKTFGDKIVVGDLKLPEGVEPMRDLDEIVANVSEPKEEVEETPIEPAESEESAKESDQETPEAEE